MNLWAVALAGGVGSRFWPLSTPAAPKQLLPLVEDRPMLAATLSRLEPIVPVGKTLVLTGESLVAATLAGVPRLSSDNIVAEPRAAGTAPALAWAAREIEARDGPDAVMLCVHADWHIRDPEAFRESLIAAAAVAVEFDSLVTVGIVPSRADPGFGYIQPGEQVSRDRRASRVERFVEKPDRARARAMCEAGYLWNSGIFAWTTRRFLAEIREHTPEVSAALDESADRAEFFGRVKPVSVDVGVLERSQRVLVIPGDFGWDDVGTWSALSRVLPQDELGNTVRGRATLVQSENNVVYASDTQVVLFGVRDLVVVSCAGVTLVTTRELASDLKQLLDAIPPSIKHT